MGDVSHPASAVPEPPQPRTLSDCAILNNENYCSTSNLLIHNAASLIALMRDG